MLGGSASSLIVTTEDGKVPYIEQEKEGPLSWNEIAKGAIQDFQAGLVQPIAFSGTPRKEAKDKTCLPALAYIDMAMMQERHYRSNY
jgi:hypothetical protein